MRNVPEGLILIVQSQQPIWTGEIETSHFNSGQEAPVEHFEKGVLLAAGESVKTHEYLDIAIRNVDGNGVYEFFGRRMFDI